jgi:hypothetical protein
MTVHTTQIEGLGEFGAALATQANELTHKLKAD